MKRLIPIIFMAFIGLNLHAQKTDSISGSDYTYSKVLALAKFHELRYLKLYAYKDSLLPEIFDQFPQLEYLEINNSHIKYIPKSVGNLSRLQTLIVCNGYSPLIIPSEIGNLTQLTKLELYNHEFTRVPSEIGNLVNLEKLMLCGDLTDLPASVSNWKRLKKMYLAGNKFEKVPSPIFQLTQLESLDLGRNDLSGVNDSVRLLKNLTQLEFEGNIELDRLPSGLCELNKLEELNIVNTKISVIPSCLNQVISLKQIRMCETLLNDPRALEAAFPEKIKWAWSCDGLERSLIDYDEVYGTYHLGMSARKDTLILSYNYAYNHPTTIDEEYSRNITIKILQKDSLQLNRIYTASNPQFILSTAHFSVWDWDATPKSQINGYIQFVEISKKRVRVYLNLYLDESWGKRKLVDKLLTFD